MSDDQGELNFSDAPVSLASVRAEKAQDGRLWTPRDVLIDVLREIDKTGKLPKTIVILAKYDYDATGTYRVARTSAGFVNRHEMIGLLVDATNELTRGN